MKKQFIKSYSSLIRAVVNGFDTRRVLSPSSTAFHDHSALFTLLISHQTRLEMIRTHLKETLLKFRRNAGVSVGLVTFSRTADFAYPLRPVVEPGVIEDLVSAIPSDGSGPTCIECAVYLILKVLTIN